MPAAKGKRFNQLTEHDIQTLSRSDLTNLEICEITGIHPGPSVSRFRRRLGIWIKMGSKKGKARPWQVKEEQRQCEHPDCSVIFTVNPSSNKRYCSRDCAKHKQRQPRPNSRAGRKPNPATPAYQRYRNKVHKLSEKTYRANKSVINPENYPRTVAGVGGGWQLDHIIEIRYGFDNNIPPEILAEVSNLRMLPWRENLARNKKSSI